MSLEELLLSGAEVWRPEVEKGLEHALKVIDAFPVERKDKAGRAKRRERGDAIDEVLDELEAIKEAHYEIHGVRAQAAIQLCFAARDAHAARCVCADGREAAAGGGRAAARAAHHRDPRHHARCARLPSSSACSPAPAELAAPHRRGLDRGGCRQGGRAGRGGGRGDAEARRPEGHADGQGPQRPRRRPGRRGPPAPDRPARGAEAGGRRRRAVRAAPALLPLCGA